MKLCVSNIAWEQTQDDEIYGKLCKMGYEGLEIAPTRIFPKRPYESLKAATEWAKRIYELYGLRIPSIQSIWFRRSERLFGTCKERENLTDYTKKAIEFATAVGAENLVFGCPSNRDGYKGKRENYEIALRFFEEVGEFAADCGTCIGIEANPEIYHTDFLNRTTEAVSFVRTVNRKGVRLNLDTAALIYYEEEDGIIEEAAVLASHVQISEPGMVRISQRKLHKKLRGCLDKAEYEGYISLEMSSKEPLDGVLGSMSYIKEVFG